MPTRSSTTPRARQHHSAGASRYPAHQSHEGTSADPSDAVGVRSDGSGLNDGEGGRKKPLRRRQPRHRPHGGPGTPTAAQRSAYGLARGDGMNQVEVDGLPSSQPVGVVPGAGLPQGQHPASHRRDNGVALDEAPTPTSHGHTRTARLVATRHASAPNTTSDGRRVVVPQPVQPLQSQPQPQPQPVATAEVAPMRSPANVPASSRPSSSPHASAALVASHRGYAQIHAGGATAAALAASTKAQPSAHVRGYAASEAASLTFHESLRAAKQRAQALREESQRASPPPAFVARYRTTPRPREQQASFKSQPPPPPPQAQAQARAQPNMAASPRRDGRAAQHVAPAQPVQHRAPAVHRASPSGPRPRAVGRHDDTRAHGASLSKWHAGPVKSFYVDGRHADSGSDSGSGSSDEDPRGVQPSSPAARALLRATLSRTESQRVLQRSNVVTAAVTPRHSSRRRAHGAPKATSPAAPAVAPAPAVSPHTPTLNGASTRLELSSPLSGVAAAPPLWESDPQPRSVAEVDAVQVSPANDTSPPSRELLLRYAIVAACGQCVWQCVCGCVCGCVAVCVRHVRVLTSASPPQLPSRRREAACGA